MMSENAIVAIKALSERYPALKGLLTTKAEAVEMDGDEAGEQPATVMTEDARLRVIEIELELLAL